MLLLGTGLLNATELGRYLDDPGCRPTPGSVLFLAILVSPLILGFLAVARGSQGAQPKLPLWLLIALVLGAAFLELAAPAWLSGRLLFANC